MVLVSKKSHKKQFFRILDALHHEYTSGQMKVPLEHYINKVVFGICKPPEQFDHLQNSTANLKHATLTKIQLSANPDDQIAFRANKTLDQFS